MTAVSSLGTNKITLAESITIGQPGSFYTAEQTITVASAGSTLLPQGVWIIVPVSNVSVEMCVDGSTWVTIIAVDTGGMIISDGYNVRLNASAAASAKVIGLA